MNNTYNILNDLANYVESILFITKTLTVNAPVGATVLTIDNTDDFNCNDKIVIHQNNSCDMNDGLQENAVKSKTDTTLTLVNPTVWDFSKNKATVKRELVRKVYRGFPKAITDYPAVVVDLISTTNDNLATRTIATTYNFEISVIVESESSEASTSIFHQLTSRIQTFLSLLQTPKLDNNYGYDSRVNNVLYDTKSDTMKKKSTIEWSTKMAWVCPVTETLEADPTCEELCDLERVLRLMDGN